MKKRSLVLVPFLAIAFLLGHHLTADAERGPSARPRSEIERAILTARDQVMPALVFVKPVQEVFDWGEKAKRQIFGSGVIFTPDGYVLTNNHVAEKSTSIVCVLADRREVPAEVVARDPETDLAVLRLVPVEEELFSFARLGRSADLEIGDFVMALGSPYGFERSLSFGVVSSTDRYLDLSPFNLWIQTDAAINPGNSGGPLVNADGEVVGINSLGIFGADNLGFAIPLDEVRDVIVGLWRKGGVTRAYTGLTLQATKDFRRMSLVEGGRGVLVSHVEPESPADAAGVRAGDAILAIGGEPVDAPYDPDLPGIRRRLASLPVEAPTELLLMRREEPLTIRITPVAKGKQEGEEFEAREWAMTVKEIVRHEDPAIAFFRKEGVYVLGAQWGGAAQVGGLRPRDILLRIGDRPIESMEDFETVLAEYVARPRGERRALVTVDRGGLQKVVVVQFERDAEAEAAEEESR